ncbi:MAG: DNA polymerase III subunit gamma/tau [Candidatus Glassbacteria bacterium]|nr:DNA polymerase III subunit gamma/tau [Candidatus Glassbacteria bacterium]
MSYLVLARKYRPLTFGEIIAQQHVTTTLVNAIAAERISHAYLFTGPRGVGKTSTARILARAVNCLEPAGQEPCNKCSTCLEILGGHSLDILEIDGASNRGIDEIRDLRERVSYAPSSARYKIYIIDEVHMLTQEAFNALLKTLEEPPSHVIFIFATTAVQKVPPTILSRCQRFDFKAVPTAEIAGQLQRVLEAEKISMPEEITRMIARKADGAVRDALSLLDQVISFCGDEFTALKASQVLGVFDADLFFELTELVAGRDTAAAVRFVDRLAGEGIDLAGFFQELAVHYRNLTAFKLGAREPDTAHVSPATVERYAETAGRFDLEDLVRSLQLILGFEEIINNSGQQKICLELLLIRLTLMEKSVNISELLSRLETQAAGPGHQAGRLGADSADVSPGGTTAPGKPAGNPYPAAARPAVKTEDHPRPAPPAPAAAAPEVSGQESGRGEEAPEGGVSPVVQGPASLEAFRQNWPRVIQQAKLKSVVLAPLLSSVEPGGFDGSCLELNINPSLTFYRDKLKEKNCQKLICEVIKELFGLEKLRIEIIASEQAAVPGPPGEEADHSPGQQSFEQLCRSNPVMNKLKKLFDPELIA